MQVPVAAVLGILIAGLSFPAGASAAECTDTWVGPSEGVWATSTNWSAGHVPTSADVACLGAGKTAKVTSGTNQVGVIQGEGKIAVSKSTLEITNGLEASTINSFTMELSGVLTGRGTLRISGTFNWANEGTMSGSGSTVILPGASGTATPGWTARLKKRRFVNEGVFSLQAGQISESEGAVIENTGTFNVNSEFTPTITSEGGAGLFVNSGTLRKGTGTGSTVVGVELENIGSVAAQTGTVKLRGGAKSSAGHWETSTGGLLVFDKGSYALNAGRISGPAKVGEEGGLSVEDVDGEEGHLELATHGVLTIPGGSTTFGSVTAGTGTTISGAGTLKLSGLLNIASESAMSGAGKTVILPGAEAIFTPGWTETIRERLFVNEGTAVLKAGRIMLSEGAVIENPGTFKANSESGLGVELSPGTGASQIVNTGTFEKTEGTGATRVGVKFQNQGAIKQISGVLKFENKYSVPYSSATPHHACAGEPVDCGTGNFTETQSDLAIGGRGVGLDVTRTYSAQGAAAGSLGIFGYGWTSSFGDKLTAEESGAKQTLTEAAGATVTFSKSGATWLAPSWSQDALSGSAESGFTLTLPSQIKEKFSGTGHLESITDRNGNEATVAYNGSGELETITDPTGRKITLTYNAEGLVEKAKDPMGHEVRYTYESKNLKSVTLPGEASPNWQFKYDASHRMTSFTDGRGGKTTNEYDASNRVISQTDPASRTTTWKYEAFHTTITNKATGAVTDEWFNSSNQPYSITRGFGTVAATTESFTYTAAGLLASRTDGNGHTTAYGYDAEGNRTSERDAEGDESKWTYNEVHQIVSETMPRGEKTAIVRDADGNPETVSRPAPESKTQTVSYEYGPHGEVKSMTNPLGQVWSYEYDSNGDLKAEIDPEGDKRSWVYDEDNRVISTTSPRGNEEGAEAAKFMTTIERDAQGRPIKITNPLGGTTKRAYDADGNVESFTDPNGHKTKFTYDADNERAQVELPNGAVEETGYDGAGQVTSQIDGNKDKTTYVRNVLEQPIEIIDPLERKTIQTFDAAGKLKTETDPDGRTTSFAYGKADRLKEIAYSAEASQDVTFGYDEDGNLTSMVDGTGESTWEYDQLGRLTHSNNGDGETVTWEWNLADEPVGIAYPNGKSISRAYDKVGRLESVTDWLGHTTSSAYNRDSDPTATTFPAATIDTDEYAWDRADRMSAITMKKGAEALASLAYSRDPAGQLESVISNGLPGAGEESFSYDANERLTKASAAEFGYDAANNITKGPGTTNAFDKASEIESVTGASFTFDKEGERTKETPSSRPATTYKYNQAGALTAIERPEEGEAPAISESLGYDGNGLLASRTVGLSTTHFVWDLSESPGLLLWDGADSYIYGPGGMPFEQISDEEVPTYLHHDQLGSTRLLTNSSGEAVATFTYGPYGVLAGRSGTVTTALTYAGQYTLGQSGLQYLRARFYDPATAQFMTRDPAVEVTRQPYLYGGDNPLRFYDRTGQGCEETVNIGPFTTTAPNLVDCIVEGAREIVESPATGPAVGVACVVAEPCPEIGGAGAGIGFVLGGNLLHSEKDPCFNQVRADVAGTLTTIGAALPGLLVEGAAARAGVDVPTAVRIGNSLPGWILEGIHAMEGR